MKKRIVCFLCLFLLIGLLPGCGPTQTVDPEKPVIYLYPEEETEVTVKLDYNGTLTSTYPAYGDGWTVTAQPDGTLTDEKGREYYCLFWEGESDAAYDFSTGYCVTGKDTAVFSTGADGKRGQRIHHLLAAPDGEQRL